MNSPTKGRMFERRRCPYCNSGVFKRLPQAVGSSPNLRKCDRCNRVFDLFREGVRETAKKVRHGSGVIPVPVRERPWKPLKQPNWSHRALAELVHR